MTSHEVQASTESAEPNYPSTSTPYSAEESHWSRNHGPVLFAIALFTLLVGYGGIFFNSAEVSDNTRPLVPNNFVPDDDPSNLDANAKSGEPLSEGESSNNTESSQTSQAPEK